MSAFWKDFTDPIERTLLLAVELQSTWRNIEKAENFGAELEFRRGLGFIAEPLEPFVLQLNYTYVDSEANYPDRLATSLPGQSENVGNLAVVYEKYGVMVRPNDQLGPGMCMFV
mgnify:CR=1 FL=1